jgi:ketosteroid isomerase-like protein
MDTESAIHELARNYQDFFNARKLDNVVALFTDDGSLLVPNCTATHGRAAILALLQQTVRESDPRNCIIETTQYEFSRDIAFSIGSSSSNVRLPDGTRFDDRSKWVSLMRNERGVWKIVALMYNSDPPAQL